MKNKRAVSFQPTNEQKEGGVSSPPHNLGFQGAVGTGREELLGNPFWDLIQRASGGKTLRNDYASLSRRTSGDNGDPPFYGTPRSRYPTAKRGDEVQTYSLAVEGCDCRQYCCPLSSGLGHEQDKKDPPNRTRLPADQPTNRAGPNSYLGHREKVGSVQTKQ